MYKTADVIVADFHTFAQGTGVATDADSLPAGTLVINGTDDAATVTVTNKEVGVYKASVTLPTVADGDVLQLRLEYAISAASYKRYIWTGAGVDSHMGDIGGQIDAMDSGLTTDFTTVTDAIEVVDGVVDAILVDTAAIGDTINVIAVPMVAYDGSLNLYVDDSYDGTLNPTVDLSSTLATDISSATHTIVISSEVDGGGTVYYTAADGTAAGSAGAWTVSFSIPTTGTDDLPKGPGACHYHTYATSGSSVATTAKGKVNVR